LLLGCPCNQRLPIENLQSKIENPQARVAELADAPDLGLQNHRFQDIALRFKENPFYEGKTAIPGEIMQFAKGQQNSRHSSTNPSTPTRQTFD
jgi:hypothetical protein